MGNINFKKNMGGEHKIEDGHMSCEADDKCLICIPIDIGVKISAVLCILGAAFNCVLVVESLSSLVLLIFIGASCFFNVVAGLICLKFLMDGNQENKDLLPKSVISGFIAICIQQVGVYLAMSGDIGGGLDAPGEASGTIIGLIVGLCMNVLFSFYFYKVMIKYSA